MPACGIDIGGTSTRVGIVREDGAVLAFERFATPGGFAALVTSIRAACERLASNEKTEYRRAVPVGVALPGLLDKEAGRVVRSVNLPWIEGYAAHEFLGVQSAIPVCSVSDADAAAWGEYSALVDVPTSFAHLRIGTGVACGVILGGKSVALEREPGRHAEILRIIERRGLPVCPCGLHGCLEAVASRAALAGECIGDGVLLPAATEKRIGEAVVAVIRRLVQHYRLEVLVLGGGVVAEMAGLFRAIRAELGTSPARILRKPQLGDMAGVVGAAQLAANRFR